MGSWLPGETLVKRGGDTSGFAIRGQIFDVTPALTVAYDVAVKAGDEFLVNTTTTNGQAEPSVTGLAGGGFVVTWRDDSHTGW